MWKINLKLCPGAVCISAVVFQISFTVTSIGSGATCTAIAIDFQAEEERWPPINFDKLSIKQ